MQSFNDRRDKTKINIYTTNAKNGANERLLQEDQRNTRIAKALIVNKQNDITEDEKLWNFGHMRRMDGREYEIILGTIDRR